VARRIRNRLVSSALAALALSFSGTGWAQEGRKSDFSSTVTIQQVDEAEMKLVVEENGASRTLFAEADTRILDGARQIALRDLARGTRVAVDATYEGPRASGRLIADRIAVVREPAAPAR
jgi:hypothetical protein